MDNPNQEIEELTRDQVWSRAEELAQRTLGVSAPVAFAMVRRGDLDGKLIEAKLQSLWFLLHGAEDGQLAAE